MTATLVIPGRLPGMNEAINASRTNPYKGGNQKRGEQRKVLACIHAQLHGVRFTKPVYMAYTWCVKDKRRDKDNISGYGRKIIQDALVEAGVLKNDGWGNIARFSDNFSVDAENPRIIVEITDEMEETG